jgi:hypothetical protein
VITKDFDTDPDIILACDIFFHYERGKKEMNNFTEKQFRENEDGD